MEFLNTLFSSSDLSGCGWTRSFLPSKNLNAHFLGGYSKYNSFDGIKNIILQRHTHIDFIDIIKNHHDLGKKVFYDIDDDLWNIDSTNPAKNAYTSQLLSNIECIMKECDGIFTSTEYLKNKLTQFHDNVIVVPNLVELPTTQKEVHSKLRIGYSGSKSHVGDFSDKLVYTLKKLFNKYNDKIELIFFGYIPPELKPYSTFYNGVKPNHYIESLNYMDIDIALAPLSDTEFNKSKSNLKWLDYSVCKSVTVASNVHCYSEIEDGVNGFKVCFDMWYDVLEELIHNKELREAIKGNSYDHVLNHYSWEKAKHKQQSVYERELK